MSSQQELKCNQCLQLFTKSKIPLKMPVCKHNICQQCLQQLRAANLDSVQCSFCDSIAVKILNKKFVPNRPLTIKLKEKNWQGEVSSETSVSMNNSLKQESVEENQFLLDDQSLQKKKPQRVCNKFVEFCEEHEKNFEIICVTDMKMICSHCAIFGNHKDHLFKTIKQFSQDCEQQVQKIQKIKHQKYIYEKKLKNIKQKGLQSLINEKKQSIRSQISLVIQKLRKDVDLLQQTTCVELNNFFSNVFKQAQTMLEKQNKLQMQYMTWQSQCQNLIQQIQKNQDLSVKIKNLYNPSNKFCLGNQIMQKIQKKGALQTKKINSLINSISLQRVQMSDLSKVMKIVKKAEENKKDSFSQMIQKISLPRGKHVLQDLQNYNDNSFLSEVRQQCSLIIEPESKRNTNKSVMAKRSPQHKIQNSASLYRSPHKKNPSINDSVIVRAKSNTQIKLNELMQNTSSPNLFQTTLKIECRDPNPLVLDFINHDLKQVLDLSRCQLDDQSIIGFLKQVRKHRKIRGLKLCQNYLTDHGFQRIIQYIGSTTNLNLSYNKLTEESLSAIIKFRDKISPLRIVNMSFNMLNDKKSKTRIDTLKKMGIIVNI